MSESDNEFENADTLIEFVHKNITQEKDKTDFHMIHMQKIWNFLWQKVFFYKEEFNFYFKKCTEQDDEIAALEARVKELEDSAERRITINNDLIDRIKELEEERNNNVRETVIRN